MTRRSLAQILWLYYSAWLTARRSAVGHLVVRLFSCANAFQLDNLCCVLRYTVDLWSSVGFIQSYLPDQVVTYFAILDYTDIWLLRYALPDPAFDKLKKMSVNFQSKTKVKIVVIFPFSGRLRILKGRRGLDAWTRKMHYLKFAAFLLSSFSHSHTTDDWIKFC